MLDKKLNKNNYKLRSLLRVFNPSSRRGAMSLFVLIFALVGGGYAAYRTFAAPAPPAMMTTGGIIPAIASDGYKGDINCMNIQASTGYGPLHNCVQFNYYLAKGDHSKYTKGRNGLYSPVTKKFSPATGWLSVHEFRTSNQILCKNMDNYFLGTSYLQTGYGPISYGQVLRYYTYKDGKAFKSVWQVKWANYSPITKNCNVEGNWMTATGAWPI